MRRWSPSARRIRLLIIGLLLGLWLSLGSLLIPTFASDQTDFEQGLAAYQAGEFQSAIAHWQIALEAPATAEQEAQIWGNLAIAYYETGQYRHALAANQTAIAQFTKLGQTAAVGQVQSNLGNVYEALGLYDRAIELYETSLEVAQATQNRFAEGVSLGNLGYLYFLQERRDDALAAYRQSLAIAEEVGDREGAGHRYLNLAIAHHAIDDLKVAQTYYQQALTIAEDMQQLALQAKALNGLGMLEADHQKFEQAIAYYERSLSITETLQNPELQARTLNNLGHTLLAADRLNEAEARLREAIARFEDLRNNLEDSYGVAIFDTQIYSYNLLTQILIAKGEPEAALEVAEAGRARAFSQLLQNRFGQSIPQTREAAMPLAIADIRRLAQEKNATLIEYALVPEEAFRVVGRQRGRTSDIHIWVIQPDGQVTFRQQAISPEAPQLAELVAQSRESLGVRGRGVGVLADSNTAAQAEKLQQLHQLLIAPIQDLLPTNPDAEVVLIPQESLFLVPFPALMDDRGDYLIQHHTLLTAPSLQILSLTQQTVVGQSRSVPQPKRALIVGNPTMPEIWEPRSEKMQRLSSLPAAETEAVRVAELLNAEPLIGATATESAIRNQIETADLIHLATHGLLEYGEPQESGLQDVPGAIALAPQDDYDGLLTSAEILDELTIQADLVVLSACDTGRGEITGDGVVGLSRAFLGAGAASVMVSLWSVPDAPTAKLMINFYEAWSQTEDKGQALRQAMLATLAEHPNPKNWAAFTLVGAM